MPDSQQSGVVELLRAYRRVELEAEALPALVWLRSRPAGTSMLPAWVRFPHLTIGTAMFVRKHAASSVDRLLRAYAANAALGELDEQAQRDRASLNEFRSALRPVPTRWIVVGALVTSLLLGRRVIAVIAPRASDWLSFGLTGDVPAEQAKTISSAQQMFEQMLGSASSLSAASLSETADQLLGADLELMVAILGTLFAAAYVVLRPFSTSFRVKRSLLNLAGQDAVSLYDSGASWHVSRSVGLYEKEQAVFAAAGARHQPERPLDLLLSLAATALLGWAMASYAITTSDTTAFDLVLVVWFLALRLAWLVGTVRARKADPTQARPDYRSLPQTGLPVACRDVTEPVGLSSIFLTPFVWYRLTRETDRLAVERQAAQFGSYAPPRRWRALGAAFVMYLFPPAAFTVRLWRLRRAGGLQWADPTIPPVLTSILLYVSGTVLYEISPVDSFLENVGFVFLLFSPALGVGANQVLLNRHALDSGVSVGLGASPVRSGPVVFCPPPSWPPAPEGFSPGATWRPDPSWPAPPAGWQFWTGAGTRSP